MDSTIDSASVIEVPQQTPIQEWSALFKAAVDWRIDNEYMPSDRSKRSDIIKKTIIKLDSSITEALYNGWMDGSATLLPTPEAHEKLLGFLRDKKEEKLPRLSVGKGLGELCKAIGSLRSTLPEPQKKIVIAAINSIFAGELKRSGTGEIIIVNVDNLPQNQVITALERAIAVRYPETPNKAEALFNAIAGQIHTNYLHYQGCIDQMKQLYRSVARSSWAARSKRDMEKSAGEINGAASDSFSEEEIRILNSLRVPASGIPYSKMNDGQLDKVIQHTRNAAEYLECYILRHHGVQTNKYFAEITGLPETTFRGWRTQTFLPAPKSFAIIQGSDFFKTAADGKHFEELTNGSRHELMKYALHRANYDAFGQQLSFLSSSFAFKELLDALYEQPDLSMAWQKHSFVEKGSLVATQGIFLHLLRKTLELSKQPIEEELGLAIKRIEQDNFSRNPGVQNGIGAEGSDRNKLFKYYIHKLEALAEKAHDPAHPDYAKAHDAENLLFALRDHEVKKWIENLPQARKKRAREGDTVWTEISQNPSESIRQL